MRRVASDGVALNREGVGRARKGEGSARVELKAAADTLGLARFRFALNLALAIVFAFVCELACLFRERSGDSN